MPGSGRGPSAGPGWAAVGGVLARVVQQAAVTGAGDNAAITRTGVWRAIVGAELDLDWSRP